MQPPPSLSPPHPPVPSQAGPVVNAVQASESAPHQLPSAQPQSTATAAVISNDNGAAPPQSNAAPKPLKKRYLENGEFKGKHRRCRRRQRNQTQGDIDWRLCVCALPLIVCSFRSFSFCFPSHCSYGRSTRCGRLIFVCAHDTFAHSEPRRISRSECATQRSKCRQ